MDGKFSNEDSEYSPENSGGDSPRTAISGDSKIASTSSSKTNLKKSRKGQKKRVVSFPMREAEGIRVKGYQMNSPPFDSWAWRKYGQKPIKGSPYPRGYYRCSSSKGCPAKKQVERSKTDPQMIIVSYSCDHNHPCPPPPRTNHHSNSGPTSAAATAKVTASTSSSSEEEEEEEEEEEQKPEDLRSKISQEVVTDYKLTNVSEGPSSSTEFGWFFDFEPTNFCTMLESSIYEEGITVDSEMAMSFTISEEDEPLFADLGVLPECSTVFRRGMYEREAVQRRNGLATHHC